MSMTVDEEFKRWSDKCKAALVTEIIQGKTSVAEASRAFDIPPSVAQSTWGKFIRDRSYMTQQRKALASVRNTVNSQTSRSSEVWRCMSRYA